MGFLELAVAVAIVALAVGAWVVYQLLLMHGRLLLRVEALERQLGQLAGLTPPDEHAEPAPGSPSEPAPPGVPIGTVLHDFDLPDLAGGRVTLSQWRGRSLLLVFISPDCEPSRALLEHLGPLTADGDADRPMPLLVSTGDRERNRRLAEQYAIRAPILLQEYMEVGAMYETYGTPTGYLVDEDGRTVSPLAVGPREILALLGASPDRPAAPNGRDPNGLAHVHDLTTPGRAEPTPNRDGLPAGTAAPHFVLPRVDGGELALADYRGRRVLLVFSDPHCPPCDALAPRLEQLHREAAGIAVLMVSRGDLAANRAMVARHGLTFPVAVQPRWDVSRAYETLEAPVGFLIDGRGAIEASAAVGEPAILALATEAASHSGGEDGVTGGIRG